MRYARQGFRDRSDAERTRRQWYKSPQAIKTTYKEFHYGVKILHVNAQKRFLQDISTEMQYNKDKHVFRGV